MKGQADFGYAPKVVMRRTVEQTPKGCVARLVVKKKMDVADVSLYYKFNNKREHSLLIESFRYLSDKEIDKMNSSKDKARLSTRSFLVRLT